MRFLGKKTKLLPHIQDLLDRHGLLGSTLIDIFSGTSAVGRHFKKLGYRVIANDHLPACYTQAVAEIEVSRCPGFIAFRRKHQSVMDSMEFKQSFPDQSKANIDVGDGVSLRSDDDHHPLCEVIHFANLYVPPREGIIFRNYCPSGHPGGMYFRDEHGKKIDGLLEFLRASHQDGLLSHSELHLFLASLLEAADRVANICGIYGAPLKTFQPNTKNEMRLDVPTIIPSHQQNEAHMKDGNQLVRIVDGDVLYIDPPYNHRQYAANYHIPTIIAEHHRTKDLAAYEAALYGKTRLRPYSDLRSVYCVKPGKRGGRENALTAMTDLILNSHTRYVVVSYSEEGILSREQIGDILARFSGTASFDYGEGLQEIPYRRFRSDADRPQEDSKCGRRYRALEGRKENEVIEYLFFAARDHAGIRGTRYPALQGATARHYAVPRPPLFSQSKN